MQKNESYLQKINSFPANIETLLLFHKNNSWVLICIQILVTLFFLFILGATATGSLPGTTFSTLLFTFITFFSIYTIINQVTRIFSNKNICLAKDHDWLYIDEFNPKKIKIDQIAEVEVIEVLLKLQPHHYLAFKMKDGKTVGSEAIDWWPVDEIFVKLEKQGVKVVKKSESRFYILKRLWQRQ